MRVSGRVYKRVLSKAKRRVLSVFERNVLGIVDWIVVCIVEKPRIVGLGENSVHSYKGDFGCSSEEIFVLLLWFLV